MKETLHLFGIDLSARSLKVAVDDGRQEQQSLDFPTTESDHRCLVRRLTKSGRSARVVLEASGIYSLDLALALHRSSTLQLVGVPNGFADDRRLAARSIGLLGAR